MRRNADRIPPESVIGSRRNADRIRSEYADSTQAMLLKCLSPGELPVSSGEALDLDAAGWNDVSSAHFARAHALPFSAYERMVRPLQNSLRRYVSGGPELTPFFQACKKGDAEACATADAALGPQRAHAGEMLRKVASAFCREVYPERELAGVAVRYRERKALPWSKRSGEAAVPEDYQLGVFKLDHAVALPGLYRRGGV